MTGAPLCLHVITSTAEREGQGLLLSVSLDNKGQNFAEVSYAIAGAIDQNGHIPTLNQPLAKEKRVA